MTARRDARSRAWVTECCGCVPDLGTVHDSCPVCGTVDPETTRQSVEEVIRRE